MIRIGKTKVRTGCITCKRRRVKCDEQHPACKRCLKAGKACEGYANESTSGRPEHVKFIVYSPHNPGPVLSEHPDLDWSEQRALSYFRDRTALELAGAFQTDFWMTTILPLARHERSVKHALIALSSMHEHYSGLDHYSPTRGVDFALQHYGKAIREVVQFNHSDPRQKFEYALVTCALFSTFESLQGHYHEACSHAISGINILAEEQRKPTTDATPTRIPPEILSRFFISLSTQLMELGDSNIPGGKPDLYYTKAAIPLPRRFSSYEEALLHIEILLSRIIEYAERTEAAANNNATENAWLTFLDEFRVIADGFERWKSAFELFSASDSNEFSRETPESSSSASSTVSSPAAERTQPARSPAFLILKLHYNLIAAFTARMEHNDETVFDDFMPDLSAAVDAAEEFVHSTSTYVNPLDKMSPTRSPDPSVPLVQQRRPVVQIRPSFSLALGIVPILFLIASRVSDTRLRDRALALLRTCNRREGFWDSNFVTRVAERVIYLRTLALQMKSEPEIHDPNFAPEPGLRPPFDAMAGAHRSTSPDANIVDFKLLDLRFLPGKKCVMRYTFVRKRDGSEVPGVPVPTFSDMEKMLPGSIRHQGEYFEEMSWDG